MTISQIKKCAFVFALPPYFVEYARNISHMEVLIRVKYEITDSVRSLIPIMTELAVWGNSLNSK